MLTPNVRRTWAPVGQTPILRRSYRPDWVSVISAITISSARQWIGLYFRCHRDNISGERVGEFLRMLLRHLPGEGVLLRDSAKLPPNAAAWRYKRSPRRD